MIVLSIQIVSVSVTDKQAELHGDQRIQTSFAFG